MKVEIKIQRKSTIYEKDTKNQKRAQNDATGFKQAVSDLRFEIYENGIDSIVPSVKRSRSMFSKKGISSITKQALSSIFNRRMKIQKHHSAYHTVSLDDFPQVPDHPITDAFDEILP